MSLQEFPRVGEYVDFKDRHKNWQVGLILSKNKLHIKIRK